MSKVALDIKDQIVFKIFKYWTFKGGKMKVHGLEYTTFQRSNTTLLDLTYKISHNMSTVINGKYEIDQSSYHSPYSRYS